MKTAIVEVNSGIATPVRTPKDMRIEIVDLDLLRDGDIEDIRQYWTSELSSTGRRYVSKTYPTTFKWITDQLKD